MGEGNIASGWGATAFGGADTSSAQWSTVMGSRNKANGPNSTAMGELTIASGSHASSMGYMTKANSSYSLVIGFSNDTTCSGTGRYAWTSTDPIFIIGNGTYTSRSNAFTVLKNGNTGIGNISPTQMLDVNGNARFRSIGSDTYYAGLAITNNGTLTTSTSDISMKKDIVTINHALQKVLEMNGVYFSWKNDNLNNRRVGFIAQEMEKVLPEVVFTNPVDGLKGINYPEITAVLAQAVKEQQQQIESTKQENQKLRSELDELKSLVNTLIANQKSQSNN
jgi:hypothetical protein